MAESRTRQRKANAETADDLENQSSDDVKKEKKDPPKSAMVTVCQIVGGIFGTFLLYILLYPSPISPVPMVKEDPLPYFDGVMTPNDLLQKTTKLGVGELTGPESMDIDLKGDIYTGLNDGRIVKIEKSGNIVVLARTGENLSNCGEASAEDKCGRPLGVHLDKSEENLIICDAYFGLLQLDLSTNKLSTLVPASVGICGVPFKFLNHLAVSSKGKVYFTDSSWKWNRRDFPYLVLEGGGQGRLLSYDLKTTESEVLMDGLFFANGVSLSPEEDFVLIAETTQSRIVRFFIEGSRKGVYDLLAENLPGFPDNIRPAKGGGYWVAMGSIRKWPFSFIDSIGPYPAIKSVLAKILPKSAFLSLVKNYGLVIKLDYYGDILSSFHDTTGKVISHISEVLEDSNAGVLYLGSFRNNFLGKYQLITL